jgi:hypothetical protein
MRKAFFVKDIINIDKYIPDKLTGNTLVIHHDFYKVETTFKKIAWSIFSKEYTNHQPDNLIIVGLNRIRTPETRYDLVYPYIYNMNKFETKITIDEKPFNGEPWRLWYHYGFLFESWLGVNYSNVLESDWQHWFYREAQTAIISDENIKWHIKETFSDLPLLTTEYSFYEPNKLLIEYYTEVKKYCFEKYDTPKQLMQSILSKHKTNYLVKIKINY